MSEAIIKAIGFIVGFLALVFVFSFINAVFVSMLWNWLVPILLPEGPLVATITYWQAWGVAVLFALLIPRSVSTRSKD